jgi:REP element-mobilizing transposase RayT
MPTRTNIPYNYGIFYITFTNYKWISLFDIANAYDLVYKWFDYLIDNGHYVIGYVIMPNHLHVIIGFRDTGNTINSIIGNAKRFLAYGIVEKLKNKNEVELLEKLIKGVKNTDKERKKLHEVFEESFDWKECISDDFIQQKLDYIHNNPCSGKWKLVENPSDYLYSSAAFYILDRENKYVTSFMMMHDIDLCK